MHVDDEDVANAEFSRLYATKDFYGSSLLRALERTYRGHSVDQDAEGFRLPEIAEELGEIHFHEALRGVIWAPSTS